MISLKDIFHGIEGLCLLPQWWMQKLKKRDLTLWTFDSWEGKHYADNPRALYEYVLAHRPDIHPVWMTNSTEVYERLKKEGKPVAMRHSKEGKRIQKKAGYFFCTHGRLDGCSEGELQYMNGIRYVNLWHGVPIKQIGDDERQFKYEISPIKRLKTQIRRLILPWEFITGAFLCGSEFFLPFIQSAFGRTYKNIIVNPEPRLDKMFISYKDAFVTVLDKQYGQPTKVLYMPTFRDTSINSFNPFNHAGFDAEMFHTILEENNIVFLYKGHFLAGTIHEVEKYDRIKTITDADYDDLYSFIKDMDILITDYSSVYFDFLCLRKPILLFPFDYDDYTQHSRPFYFDYNLMQAKCVYSWTELAECLKNRLNIPIPTDEELHRFRPQQAKQCCATLVRKLLSSSVE